MDGLTHLSLFSCIAKAMTEQWGVVPLTNESTQYIARISYGKDSLKMLDGDMQKKLF